MQILSQQLDAILKQPPHILNQLDLPKDLPKDLNIQSVSFRCQN